MSETGGESRRGWNLIYQSRGAIQHPVLEKVVSAADVIEQRGGRDILDLGCGTGRHSFYLASRGFSVVASDLARDGLILARDSIPENSNIPLIQHDMKALPFESNRFDAVICTFVLDHGTSNDLAITVDEILRTLRPGGTILTDLTSVEDETYGLGDKVEECTYRSSMPGEDGVLHHYSTIESAKHLFRGFSSIQISPVETEFKATWGENHVVRSLDVLATKGL
jgi:ubiquinone/menaquinone biosynthesis C-methylase UbiE